MSFKYNCIGDNTPENREWLEKVGYELVVNSELDKYICVFHDSSYAIGGNFIPDCFYHKAVKCIGNPQLFKAVSAMRDDSDYMQWFVTDADQAWVNQGMYVPKGSLELCLVEDRYMGQNPIFCSTIVPAHKATLKELQEHFKANEIKR